MSTPDPFVIVRFGIGMVSYYHTVSEEPTLSEAIADAHRKTTPHTERYWPNIYIAVNNVIVANVKGPDMRESSCAFVSDYFQSCQPVHQDETLGDSI